MSSLNICPEDVLNPYTADFELHTLPALSSLHCFCWALSTVDVKLLTMLMMSFLMLTSLRCCDELTSF